MLSKMKSNQSGFTIVELLIVIVVIAILAAITIVAYNGIQSRARTSSAQAAANTLIKKAEAANSINSGYPTAVVATTGFAVTNGSEPSLAGTGITLSADITAAPSAPATVQYIACGSGTGAKVTYWDYTASAKAAYQYLGTATSANCTATTGGLAGGPY